MHTMIHIAAWAAASVAVAELLGYLLHRLMHSGWIPWLSASHMKHHMVLYAPLQKQRPSEQYLDATVGQAAIGNIGLEWIIPSTVILTITVAGLSLFRVPWTDQAVSIGTILAWSFLMFSYLHDRMHIQNFWMERAFLLRHWFLRARRLHDIHHHTLNDRGLMDRNFGIGFFVFDRLFGTLAIGPLGFNHRGLAAARERFRSVYGAINLSSEGRELDSAAQRLLGINVDDLGGSMFARHVNMNLDLHAHTQCDGSGDQCSMKVNDDCLSFAGQMPRSG